MSYTPKELHDLKLIAATLRGDLIEMIPRARWGIWEGAARSWM